MAALRLRTGWGLGSNAVQTMFDVDGPPSTAASRSWARPRIKAIGLLEAVTNPAAAPRRNEDNPEARRAAPVTNAARVRRRRQGRRATGLPTESGDMAASCGKS